MEADTLAELTAQIGQCYVSDWLLVDQALIDSFADTTRDWNFMHVDPEAAGRTEFGGTIAHGFLVLSLLAPVREMAPRPRVANLRVGLNYGIDRLRFVAPVRSGSSVRGRFTPLQITEEAPGKLREVMQVEVEIEGQERPAIVASWLTMYLL
jgi:acyl dehydratase